MKPSLQAQIAQALRSTDESGRVVSAACLSFTSCQKRYGSFGEKQSKQYIGRLLLDGFLGFACPLEPVYIPEPVHACQVGSLTSIIATRSVLAETLPFLPACQTEAGLVQTSMVSKDGTSIGSLPVLSLCTIDAVITFEDP